MRGCTQDARRAHQNDEAAGAGATEHRTPQRPWGGDSQWWPLRSLARFGFGSALEFGSFESLWSQCSEALRLGTDVCESLAQLQGAAEGPPRAAAEQQQEAAGNSRPTEGNNLDWLVREPRRAPHSLTGSYESRGERRTAGSGIPFAAASRPREESEILRSTKSSKRQRRSRSPRSTLGGSVKAASRSTESRVGSVLEPTVGGVRASGWRVEASGRIAMRRGHEETGDASDEIRTPFFSNCRGMRHQRSPDPC